MYGDLISQGPCVTGDLAFGSKRSGTLHSRTLCPCTITYYLFRQTVGNISSDYFNVVIAVAVGDRIKTIKAHPEPHNVQQIMNLWALSTSTADLSPRLPGH